MDDEEMLKPGCELMDPAVQKRINRHVAEILRELLAYNTAMVKSRGAHPTDVLLNTYSGTLTVIANMCIVLNKSVISSSAAAHRAVEQMADKPQPTTTPKNGEGSDVPKGPVN